MKIKCDAAGKKAIIDLCHIATVNTDREHFEGNLTGILQILASVELLPEEKPIAQTSADIPQTNEAFEELRDGC